MTPQSNTHQQIITLCHAKIVARVEDSALNFGSYNMTTSSYYNGIFNLNDEPRRPDALRHNTTFGFIRNPIRAI